MAAEQYREAIARGHPESARLTVRRLRALFVANRVAEAEAALGALPDDPGLDALRGQVLLLRAEVAFLDAGRAEEARALLRQALAAPGLSGAEVAYAHGLLADSVLDMLGRFEEAVDRDPNYYPGQTALTVGLLVTGRYADARIRIRFVRGLFPDDRFPEFAEGLVDLYSGAVSAGLKRLEQVAAQMGGPRGEWVRSHARKLANQLTAVGELNARSGMASGVMLTDKTLKEREVNGAELRQMFSPDGFPLVVPSPVVSRLFDPGVAYFDAARILVTERDPAKAAAVAETALARDPDASLAAFACQLRFLTAAQLYSAPKRDTKRLEAEMRRAVALGERAITDPCRYAGSSFRYEGRVFSVLALGCLAQPNEFPDAAREFRPRLRAALPQLVAEGANFPQMRREAVAALVNTGLLDPTEWRAVLSDWSAADSADPQPLELLAAMELNAGNGAAARDVAARATAAFPNDTGLKSRLEVLFPPVPSIPAAAP
jgi:tetratricopeptide (TPR) repeat protein